MAEKITDMTEVPGMTEGLVRPLRKLVIDCMGEKIIFARGWDDPTPDHVLNIGGFPLDLERNMQVDLTVTK